MKELTVIVTIEVTKVIKEPEGAVNKEKSAENIKVTLKDLLDADDVVVTNIQEFVREGEK